MNTVWKIVISFAANEEIYPLPAGARFIHFDRDTREPGKFSAWFQVETGNVIEQRRFRIRGTGRELDAGSIVLGTVLDSGSTGAMLSWHLEEVPMEARP